jgi:hypothetical protein
MSATISDAPPGGFYPRTTEDQAKPTTVELLRENGIAQYIEAALYSALATEVIGSTNQKLVSLQPTIVSSATEEWSRAYDFVKNFLTLNGMTKTLAALGVEFPKIEGLQLRETFSDLDRDKYFHELLVVERKTFAEKVDQFRGDGRNTSYL